MPTNGEILSECLSMWLLSRLVVTITTPTVRCSYPNPAQIGLTEMSAHIQFDDAVVRWVNWPTTTTSPLTTTVHTKNNNITIFATEITRVKQRLWHEKSLPWPRTRFTISRSILLVGVVGVDGVPCCDSVSTICSHLLNHIGIFAFVVCRCTLMQCLPMRISNLWKDICKRFGNAWYLWRWVGGF